MNDWDAYLHAWMLGPLGVATVIAGQVLLIAGLTWVVTLGMRDATQQHRVWAAGILLNLLLLPMHFIWGGWSIGLTAPARAISSGPQLASGTTVPQLAPARQEINNTDYLNQPNFLDQAPQPVTLNHQAASPAKPVPSTPSWSTSQIITFTLTSVYISVAAFLLLRFAIALRLIEQFVSRSPLVSAETHHLAERTASALGLKQLPDMRALADREPMVVGLSHTLLVPDNFDQWPLAGRQASMAHELAHVMRRDLWIEAAAKLMCCLYWFHPAAWWMRRRLKESCERATDLKALSAGQTARDYANAIVSILKHQQAQSRQPLALSATTPGPIMQQRLSYLLSVSAYRLDTHRSRLATALSVSLLALVALVSSVRIVATTLVASTPVQPSPDPAVTLAIAQTTQTPDEVPPGEPMRPDDNDLLVRMRTCKITSASPAQAGARVTASGRVVDAQGQPVSGAIVVMRESTSHYMFSDEQMAHYFGLLDGIPKRAPDVLARTQTDANGQFQFKQVAATKASTMWRGDVVAIHPTSGIAAFNLQSEENADVVNNDIDLHLMPLADITGIVVDARQNPIENALVRAQQFRRAASEPLPQPSDDVTLGITLSISQLTIQSRTDATGRFTLKNVPQEMVATLTAEHSNYQSAGFTVLPKDAKSTAKDFPGWMIPQGLQTSPCKLALAEGVSLKVQVVDDTTRKPIRGTVLKVGQSLVSQTIDETGTYTLRLPATQPNSAQSPNRLLHAQPPRDTRYLARTQDLQATAVNPGEPVTIGLSQGVWLTGKVVTDDGQPLPQTIIRVWDSLSWDKAYSALTDVTGQYKLLVPKGKHKLVLGCNDPGYQMPRLDIVMRGSQEPHDTSEWPAALADTSSGKDAALPDIVVKRSQPIECEVTFPDGTLATGASVSIMDNPMPASGGIRWGLHRLMSQVKESDAQGRVTLLTNPLGPDALVVAKLMVDNVLYQNVGTPVTKRQANGLLKVVIAPPGRLSGRVLSNGKPVAKAIVVVTSSSEAFGIRQEVAYSTDEDGKFYADALASKLGVTVVGLPHFKQALQGEKFARETAPGVYDVGDLEINLPLRELSGQLVDQNGKPVPQANVVPIPLNPNAPFTPKDVRAVTTDNAGNFRFAPVLAGDYDLSVQTSPEKEFQPANQKITAGKAAKVTISFNP